MLLSIMAWIEVDEPHKAATTRHAMAEAAEDSLDEEERQLAVARKVIAPKFVII
jgi:hypothetical protein